MTLSASGTNCGLTMAERRHVFPIIVNMDVEEPRLEAAVNTIEQVRKSIAECREASSTRVVAVTPDAAEALCDLADAAREVHDSASADLAGRVVVDAGALDSMTAAFARLDREADR